MTTEAVEHRALAAIRFLDAETRLPVQRQVRVQGGGLKFARNLSGLVVVIDAPGFTEYANHFDLPLTPPPDATFTLTATDPSRTYLPRTFTIELPRDPAPGADEDLPDDSVFKPVEVTLFPSSVARASAGSAVVRLKITDKNGVPLPGALVELTLDTPSIVRRGQADDRGEAVVMVPGIPIADWSDPVATTDFDLTLMAAWTAGTSPPNPDGLAASLQDPEVTIQVAAGAEISQTVSLEWIEL